METKLVNKITNEEIALPTGVNIDFSKNSPVLRVTVKSKKDKRSRTLQLNTVSPSQFKKIEGNAYEWMKKLFDEKREILCSSNDWENWQYVGVKGTFDLFSEPTKKRPPKKNPRKRCLVSVPDVPVMPPYSMNALSFLPIIQQQAKALPESEKRVVDFFAEGEFGEKQVTPLFDCATIPEGKGCDILVENLRHVRKADSPLRER